VSLDFTAVDFETANSQRGSVCAVGLVRVRDGRVADKSGGWSAPRRALASSLTPRPPSTASRPRWWSTTPAWREVAAWIVRYAGQDVLVCHNAGYHVSVLRHACAADDVPPPAAGFLCTMVAARRAFRLPSYRLPFVADKCGVELTGRHQVLISARGAAMVAVALARKHGASTPSELADALDIRMGCLEPGRYVSCAGRDRRGSGRDRLVNPGASPDADPDHPPYGQVIVFTGTLQTRTRQQAWGDAARAGAIPEKGVTARTNILVIGDLNPGVLTPRGHHHGQGRPRLRPAGQGTGHRGHDRGRLHPQPLTSSPTAATPTTGHGLTAGPYGPTWTPAGINLAGDLQRGSGRPVSPVFMEAALHDEFASLEQDDKQVGRCRPRGRHRLLIRLLVNGDRLKGTCGRA